MSTTLSFHAPFDLAYAVDAARGGIPRSSFLLGAVQFAMERGYAPEDRRGATYTAARDLRARGLTYEAVAAALGRAGQGAALRQMLARTPPQDWIDAWAAVGLPPTRMRVRLERLGIPVNPAWIPTPERDSGDVLHAWESLGRPPFADFAQMLAEVGTPWSVQDLTTLLSEGPPA